MKGKRTVETERKRREDTKEERKSKTKGKEEEQKERQRAAKKGKEEGKKGKRNLFVIGAYWRFVPKQMVIAKASLGESPMSLLASAVQPHPFQTKI